MDGLAIQTAEDRARTLAEIAHLAVQSTEDNLTGTLRAIDRKRLAQSLSELEETNPLVRNVFIWIPGRGLEYPPRDNSATNEEKRFAVRFEALFSGRVPWSADTAELLSSEEGIPPNQSLRSSPAKAQGALGRFDLLKNAAGANSRQKSVRSSAPQQQTQSQVAAQGIDSRPIVSHGWIPWFSDNKLYILGWVRDDKRPDSGIYGLELEVVALLSRIVARLPRVEQPGMAFAIIDGEGKAIHQAGGAPIPPEAKPRVTISLAPLLPHWYAAVYVVDRAAAFRTSRNFVILSGLLLGIFVAGVVIGGLLLLRQAHRNMLEAMRKTSFVANVSHELKTPLTSIRMYAELLKEERVEDPAKKKRYLDVIVDESQRLTRLVNNVLDFGRLEQGRKRYNPEKVDLTAFLTDLFDTHALRIEQSGMKLTLNLPDEPAQAIIDRDALEQAFLNVIDNGIKYAADGGELTVVMTAEKEACQARVMDRGPGVPYSHREKIFDKFHRVDDSLTAEKPGAGLGLSIARRMMRDLGGDLAYQPRKGGGSVFVFSIPIADGDSRK